MNSNNPKKWITFIYLLLPSVNLQYPYPPPVFAYPPPPPVPMPIAVPVAVPVMFGGKGRHATSTTTTTTTTTEESNIPIQIPIPVHISIFPQKHHHPPRLFPAPYPGPYPGPFPAPYPGPYPPPGYPMPMQPQPPPLVMLPMPPRPRRRKHPAKPASNSDESSESECKDEGRKKGSTRSKRKRRKKIGYSLKKPKYRRMSYVDKMNENMDDNDIVKPVFTYISSNGDIKLTRKLSNDEAEALINGDSVRSRASMIENNEFNNTVHKRKRIILRGGSSNQALSEGKKELIFNPPPNAQISNLSVSFQIRNDKEEEYDSQQSNLHLE